jgi:hypothetical protein
MADRGGGDVKPCRQFAYFGFTPGPRVLRLAG